ncbi:MAG: L-glyceraldehyde 3-phosphate reductase [Phycisphaerae bacterium]|nr:L-glyceraldehyde 3-phosphate reductase [Phycisphaerae bacterium]
MRYVPAADRYDKLIYNRCGNSGLLLPPVSLGLWHNFGSVDTLSNARSMIRAAFDAGITHFDLANNYGPDPGSAEENFGTILSTDLAGYRDELVISTKAGYRMWPGPYGEWGSRKYLLASLDASLLRLKIDYVDIFYSHRPDPNTPLEETMSALDQAIRSGKAVYAGISNYPPDMTEKAYQILARMGHRLLIHQPKYSMLVRTPEQGLLETLGRLGMGCIPFSPLAQGLLTDKYLHEIPADSRAAKPTGFLRASEITPALQTKLRALNGVAAARGQSLAEMALAWILRDKRVTSVLVGASRPEQIAKNLSALNNTRFAAEEIARIDHILAGA